MPEIVQCRRIPKCALGHRRLGRQPPPGFRFPSNLRAAPWSARRSRTREEEVAVGAWSQFVCFAYIVMPGQRRVRFFLVDGATSPRKPQLRACLVTAGVGFSRVNAEVAGVTPLGALRLDPLPLPVGPVSWRPGARSGPVLKTRRGRRSGSPTRRPLRSVREHPQRLIQRRFSDHCIRRLLNRKGWNRGISRPNAGESVTSGDCFLPVSPVERQQDDSLDVELIAGEDQQVIVSRIE